MPTTPTNPPLSGRFKYPWDKHAALLKRRPNTWHMLEADVTYGIASMIRSGNQPHLRPLLGHLDIKIRNSHVAGKTPRGQLWARYDPDTIVEPKKPISDNRPRLLDEQVRQIRQRCADGIHPRTIADDYGIHRSYVRSLSTGQYRAEAGGPIRYIDYDQPPDDDRPLG